MELCLKDEKVLTLKQNDKGFEVIKIDNPKLLPVALIDNCTSETFNEWLKSRLMPDNRENLTFLKIQFGEDWILPTNYASLSDQYWIKNRNETWKKINFFTNHYSEDIGNMSFVPWDIKRKKINNFSPDLTCGGVLKKCWRQNDDRTSYLVKAASPATHQEPMNEVLVSIIAEKLGISCVSYNLHIEGTSLCSVCDNFITQDTELVPASAFYFKEEKRSGENTHTHLLRMCDKFGIPGVEEYLDWLIYLDYITGNEDRNLGNIGFIRDVNTLKFIGPAPIYDSGNAFWNTKILIERGASQLFGDIEDKIAKKLKGKSDIESIRKDKNIKAFIKDYPGIDIDRKKDLVHASSFIFR